VDPAAPAEAGSPADSAPLPRRGGFIARRLQMRRDLVAQQAAETQPTLAPPAPQQRRAPQSQILARQQQLRQPPQALGQQRQPFQALRQASATAAPAMRALSSQDIAAMRLPALQTALSDTTGQLSNELNRFSSSASWQGFFNLPAGIVDEPTIDLSALQTTLARFEKVANDRQFAQIAGLESFQQARSILTELVNRADQPATGDPSIVSPQLIAPLGGGKSSAPPVEAVESLPAPRPLLPRNEGEHSILLRAGSVGRNQR
jgi:hypothetical protein